MNQVPFCGSSRASKNQDNSVTDPLLYKQQVFVVVPIYFNINHNLDKCVSLSKAIHYWKVGAKLYKYQNKSQKQKLLYILYTYIYVYRYIITKDISTKLLAQAHPYRWGMSGHLEYLRASAFFKKRFYLIFREGRKEGNKH